MKRLNIEVLFLLFFVLFIGCVDDTSYSQRESSDISFSPGSICHINWPSADSIELIPPEGELLLAGHPYFFHDKIYYLELLTSKIKIFDLAGKYIMEFGGQGDAPGMAQAGYGDLFITKNGLGAIDHILSYISYFDQEGNFQKRIILHQDNPSNPLWSYELDNSNLALVEPPYYSSMNEERFFIPTKLYWEYLSPLPNREKDYLITRFDSNGKMLYSFANYPKTQNKYLEHAQRHYVFIQSNRIYMSLEYSSSLDVFDIEGTWLKNIGIPGEYEKEGEDPIQFETKVSDQLWEHRFASTLYGEMFCLDDFPSSVFRCYRGKFDYNPESSINVNVWDKPLYIQQYYKESLIQDIPVDKRYKQYIGHDSQNKIILFRGKYEEEGRGQCKIYFLSYSGNTEFSPT